MEKSTSDMSFSNTMVNFEYPLCSSNEIGFNGKMTDIQFKLTIVGCAD